MVRLLPHERGEGHGRFPSWTHRDSASPCNPPRVRLHDLRDLDPPGTRPPPHRDPPRPRPRLGDPPPSMELNGKPHNSPSRTLRQRMYRPPATHHCAPPGSTPS